MIVGYIKAVSYDRESDTVSVSDIHGVESVHPDIVIVSEEQTLGNRHKLLKGHNRIETMKLVSPFIKILVKIGE